MKISSYEDGDIERRILSALATDKTVLGRVASLWNDAGLFSSPIANRIAGWCIHHWRKYAEPPNRAITSYHTDWEQETKDRAGTEMTARLLEACSEETARNGSINPEHVIDLAGRHFNKVRLSKLIEAAGADLEAGKLDRAQDRIVKHARVELGIGSGVELFTEEATADRRSTYDRTISEPLIEYPGALGQFFGAQLGRDCFIGYMGREKIGKSMWLLDLAWRAMLQRRKVAYFQAGDLSEWQIKDRFLVRAARHPSRSQSPDRSWPCIVKWPKALTAPGKGDDMATVDHDDKEFDRPHQSRKDWDQLIIDYVRQKTKTKRCLFKLSCHATKTLSVSAIRGILDAWELQGWVPDVVCIDYADILAPENRKDDRLEQIKTTWEQLRQLSQVLHCLLATGSQVNAASYNRRRLGMDNFSGNHLKYAEVTGMVGINMTETEKSKGIYRLNWLVRREGEYETSREVHVASCLALSNPAVLSTW